MALLTKQAAQYILSFFPRKGTMRQYIIGLGNVSPLYQCSLHNAGFAAVEALALLLGKSWQPDESLLAHTIQGELGNQSFTLLKPTTGMNDSGKSIRRLFSRSPECLPSRLLIVYDDLSLPFGNLRLREHGSAGGHLGVQSILTALETEAVPRLRLGIGPDPGGARRFSHVTSPVSTERWSEVLQMAQQAAIMICDNIRKISTP